MITRSVVIISKDDPKLGETLQRVRREVRLADSPTGIVDGDEVIVVDASRGRLDAIRQANPWVRWIDFTSSNEKSVTIPHQRNAGVRAARGEVIAFIDVGCTPVNGWLERLVTPIASGDESVTCGPMSLTNSIFAPEPGAPRPDYVDEAPTMNLAFRRELCELVGGFDESFRYGSDIDFTWRLRDRSIRLRYVPEAFVEHDWGDWRRQLRRCQMYGAARVRLYRKHPTRLRSAWRSDPVPFAYPIFLLGLPLTAVFPAYPLLLLIPLWRARRRTKPVRVVAAHLAEGLGSLREVTRILVGSRR